MNTKIKTIIVLTLVLLFIAIFIPFSTNIFYESIQNDYEFTQNNIYIYKNETFYETTNESFTIETSITSSYATISANISSSDENVTIIVEDDTQIGANSQIGISRFTSFQIDNSATLTNAKARFSLVGDPGSPNVYLLSAVWNESTSRIEPNSTISDAAKIYETNNIGNGWYDVFLGNKHLDIQNTFNRTFFIALYQNAGDNDTHWSYAANDNETQSYRYDAGSFVKENLCYTLIINVTYDEYYVYVNNSLLTSSLSFSFTKTKLINFDINTSATSIDFTIVAYCNDSTRTFSMNSINNDAEIRLNIPSLFKNSTLNIVVTNTSSSQYLSQMTISMNNSQTKNVQMNSTIEYTLIDASLIILQLNASLTSSVSFSIDISLYIDKSSQFAAYKVYTLIPIFVAIAIVMYFINQKRE